MIEKVSIYPQASAFPGQSSEYSFELCRKQLERHGDTFSHSSPGVHLVVFCVGGLSSNNSSIYISFRSSISSLSCSRSEVNQWHSRGRQTRCTAEYYVLRNSSIMLVFNVDVVCRKVRAFESISLSWLVFLECLR